MDHLEMVEKLREKANVSYEEARAALEKCNWDLLDALLMLEGEGRLNNGAEAAYSTRKAEKINVNVNRHQGPGMFAQLMHGLANIVRKCNSVSLQVKKKNEVRLALPLTVVIVLAVFAIWWLLIAAALGMVFGYRYSISGLTIDETVNNAMEKAGEFVDNVVKPVEVQVVVDDDDDSQA